MPPAERKYTMKTLFCPLLNPLLNVYKTLDDGQISAHGEHQNTTNMREFG